MIHGTAKGKKVLKFMLIEEVRRRDVIWNTENQNYLTKGGSHYIQELRNITRILKERLSPRLNITRVKNEWQKLKEAYTLNYKQ